MKFLFASFLPFLLCFAAFGAGGTDVGRGGNLVALDFRSLAIYDLQLLRQQHQTLVDLDALEEMIASTKLDTLDRVFLRGEEKDAVNYSDPPRIIIGASRWLQLPAFDSRKDALVLHEYISLLGLDDSRYEITNQLLLLLKRGIPRNGDSTRACFLFKESAETSHAAASARLVGRGAGELTLTAESITARLTIDMEGSISGARVELTIADGQTEIGRLDLPFLTSPPPSLDLFSRDLKGDTWRMHCSLF